MNKTDATASNRYDVPTSKTSGTIAVRAVPPPSTATQNIDTTGQEDFNFRLAYDLSRLAVYQRMPARYANYREDAVQEAVIAAWLRYKKGYKSRMQQYAWYASNGIKKVIGEQRVRGTRINPITLMFDGEHVIEGGKRYECSESRLGPDDRACLALAKARIARLWKHMTKRQRIGLSESGHYARMADYAHGFNLHKWSLTIAARAALRKVNGHRYAWSGRWFQSPRSIPTRRRKPTPKPAL